MIVSAALSPNGTARRALSVARSHYVLALSPAVFDEIAAVMARPKFSAALPEQRQSQMLELLAAASAWAEPSVRVTDCRDGKDNRYLELALAVAADVIVSGDQDLLVLDPWRNTRIVTPGVFLSLAEPATCTHGA